MITKEAEAKWHISERRIRQLIQDGRILNARKVGKTWLIPSDTNKPIDKRNKDNFNFIINLENNYFDEVNYLKNELDKLRPISKKN